MTKLHSLSDYPHPSVAVDLAILTVLDGALHVLLTRRDDAEAVGGVWSMPGGFVHIDKTPEDTVVRVLRDKARLHGAHMEQLATYGSLDRDPRGRVISIVYLALVPAHKLLWVTREQDDLMFARISVPWDGESGGPVMLTDSDNASVDLAFDHVQILGDVVKRMRGKLDYSAVGYALLASKFTLRNAQEVHQAILGRTLAKPAFRRKLLDRGLIRPTGEYEKGGAYRPAELYELKTEK